MTPELLARWALPAVWITLPFLAGPALADALDPRSRPVQLVASTLLWLAWAVALGAALVPRTTSLTAVRIIVPASVLATGWALIAGPSVGVAAVVGVAISAVATVVALSSFVGDVFVNGSAYGDERRMPLRPPATLLAGPMELAWLVCIVGAGAGPLLLAAGSWVLGALLLAVGWPAAWFAARALHGLSRRWIVFVPAGFVLHDLMAVAEPLLLPRRLVVSVGPALADSHATDLTAGALGLALQADLSEPTTVNPAPRRGRPGERPQLEALDVESLLFTPSRPGAVLHEARRRRLRVG